MTLKEIYQKYSKEDGTGDKGTSHSYIPYLYSLLFESKRNEALSILEIGVGWGYSLKLWEDFFINATSIIGLDINLEQNIFEFGKAKTFLCNATNKEQIDNCISDMTFDIIIDDGSHNVPDQRNSFDLLFGKVNKGGCYIIEDILELDNLKGFLQDKGLPYLIYDGVKYRNRKDDIALVIYKE